MAETRKLAAILAVDVAGYSAGADEERTLARLRALRSDLIDPTITLHHGRVVKRTRDGVLIEFRSVVDAVKNTLLFLVATWLGSNPALGHTSRRLIFYPRKPNNGFTMSSARIQREV